MVTVLWIGKKGNLIPQPFKMVCMNGASNTFCSLFIAPSLIISSDSRGGSRQKWPIALFSPLPQDWVTSGVLSE